MRYWSVRHYSREYASLLFFSLLGVLLFIQAVSECLNFLLVLYTFDICGIKYEVIDVELVLREIKWCLLFL